MNIYEVLKKLNISFKEIEHKEVFTSLEAEFTKSLIEGIGVKNLFLKTKKKEYYLVLIEDSKKANIKDIARKINTNHLSFASEEELKSILNLTKGSVTPLGLINDFDHQVKVLIDNRLKENKILVHPNINTKTISLEMKDLIRFLEHVKNEYYFLDL